MRVVHIEDDDGKAEQLSSHVRVDERCRDSRELSAFMRGCERNPGIAVLDVGVFSEETPEGMLSMGEELADKGWQVVYWSGAVGQRNVRDDCWYENRNDDEGVGAVASAIHDGLQGSKLRRGGRQHQRELSLELLSAFWLFGLLWEASGETSLASWLNKAEAAPDTSGCSEIGRLFIERIWASLSGAQTPDWTPSEYRWSVKALDGLLAFAAPSEQIIARWKRAMTDLPPTSLDAVVKILTESKSLEQWNARLQALRDTLLPA